MDRDQPHPLIKERLSDADQAALAVSRGGPETTPERANLPKEVCWVPTTGADILFREQAQHRITGGNPLDRLGNQGCHGQLADLAAGLCLGAQGNGVGHHDLVQGVAVADALDGRTREDRVRAVGIDTLGAALLEQIGRASCRERV